MKAPNTKRLIFGFSILVVLLAFLWVVLEVSAHYFFDSRKQSKGVNKGEVAATAEELASWKTKSRIRYLSDVEWSHSPKHLKDFYLKPMSLSGLRLDEALARVEASYRDACEDVGEVALPLVFVLPHASSARIDCETGFATVESIIDLLAGLSGMTVTRSGTRFVFRSPEPLVAGRTESRSLSTSTWTSIGIVLEASGLAFSESFREVATGEDLISLTTESAVDLAIIDSLARSEAKNPKVSQSVQSHLVRLPAGAPWDLEERSFLEKEEFRSLMRDLSSIEGVELQNSPSVIARAF